MLACLGKDGGSREKKKKNEEEEEEEAEKEERMVWVGKNCCLERESKDLFKAVSTMYLCSL